MMARTPQAVIGSQMTSPLLRLSSFFVPALTAGALISFVAAADGQSELAGPAAPADVFLSTYLGLSSSELASVHRGDIIVKTLSTDVPQEVAVAGALKIEAEPEFFVERLRDIAGFRRSENVLAVGPFGRPPSRVDLDPFFLDLDDIDDLRRCRVGRCQVKFDQEALERFVAEVDWSAEDRRQQAQVLARDALWSYLSRYLDEGRAALPVYRDDDEPVALGEGVALLLDHSPFLAEEVADLRVYLDSTPARPDERAENIFYWSNEVFGLKPVASLTHTTIWRDENAKADTVVTSQQLYASHYFDASLGVTFLFRDDRDENVGLVMAYVNRTIGDGLDGWLGGLKRSVARARARSGLSDILRNLRRRLEAQSAAR
jgi:hypothetical protein